MSSLFNKTKRICCRKSSDTKIQNSTTRNLSKTRTPNLPPFGKHSPAIHRRTTVCLPCPSLVVHEWWAQCIESHWGRICLFSPTAPNQSQSCHRCSTKRPCCPKSSDTNIQNATTRNLSKTRTPNLPHRLFFSLAGRHQARVNGRLFFGLVGELGVDQTVGGGVKGAP